MASSVRARETPGQALRPPAQPGAREFLGPYELLRCIGQGGAGVVYEAVHRKLGRPAAIKVLHSRGGDAASARRAYERFLREGRAAAMVRHPHVVGVYDFGVDGDLTFLAMEWVDGESLAQLLRREPRLPVERALGILLPMLSATAELHAAGIIHRDIKPANILLSRLFDRRPKLADFGVSRLDDGSPGITDSGALLGTLEYMAPELVRGAKAADELSDQYALAVTLYECLAGTRPFRGEAPYDLMQAIVHGDAPAPSTWEPSIPGDLDKIVLRAMHADRQMRFACIDDFADALRPFAPQRLGLADEVDVSPERPLTPAGLERRATLLRRTGGRTKRFGVSLAALGLFCALAAGASAVMVSRRPSSVGQVAPAPSMGAAAPKGDEPRPMPAMAQAMNDPVLGSDRAAASVSHRVSPQGGESRASHPPMPTVKRHEVVPRPPVAPSATTEPALPSSLTPAPSSAPLRGNNQSPILDVP